MRTQAGMQTSSNFGLVLLKNSKFGEPDIFAIEVNNRKPPLELLALTHNCISTAMAKY
jgi:hypothetical protein